MKNLLRRIWRKIAFIVAFPFLTVLDYADAFFAERKYKQLFFLTQRVEDDYHKAQKLFFADGGYEENKDRILAISKVLVGEAKSTLKALEKLYGDWGEFFDEDAKSTMTDEMESLKGILRFGEQNCNP